MFWSLTLPSMGRATLSWKAQGDLSTADLKARIPHFDPHVLFVLEEPKVSQLGKSAVSSQLIPLFQSATINIVVVAPEDVKLPKWSDKLLNQLPLDP